MSLTLLGGSQAENENAHDNVRTVTVSIQITGIRAAEFSFLVNDEAHDLAI